MKLSGSYTLSLPALRAMDPDTAQSAHTHAIMKVKRAVLTELLNF